MKVYALVGKSGTGKSYQAMNLCRDMNIKGIIDDGLFIVGGAILAGISAKRQDTKIGAVKTALFTKDEHREQVKNKIREAAPDSILIIGTSDKMVSQICEKLEIGPIEKTVYIEDITSEEEREIAYKQRNEKGKHVIPVPTFQLKKDFSGYFLDTIKGFIGWGSKRSMGEKSVVRPTYSYMGDYTISGNVIESIVRHCAEKMYEVETVHKVAAQTTKTGIVISVIVVLRYGVPIPQAGRTLQQMVANRVSMMTAFNIDAVNIEVRAA